jgi:hypothetical protein
LVIPPLPLASCVEENSVRVEYPNHGLVLFDGAAQPLVYGEAQATLDPQTESVWVQLDTGFALPARAVHSYLIELDASALPEGEAQTFSIDLHVKGRFDSEWEPSPAVLSRTPGPLHSDAVRSVEMQPWCRCKSQFDYQLLGQVSLTRHAGRVRGTLELELTGLIATHMVPPVRHIQVQACLDAPIALRHQPYQDACGTEQLDLTGSHDCGTQGIRRAGWLDVSRVDAVTECARDKLASGAPFHVRVEMQGIDTLTYLVWASGADGVMLRYHYDSGGPTLYGRRCREPRILDTPPVQSWDELIECDALLGEFAVCEPDSIFHGD